MVGIVKGLFGGESKASKQLGQFRPISFVAPGARGEFDAASNRFTVRRLPQTEEALGAVVTGFRGLSRELGALRPLVRPGFGRLTESRVRAIESGRRRTIGDLRERLARRRVLGSSFAQDVTTRAEAEFTQQEERARAESFLAELGLTTQLIGQQFQADIQAAMTELNQLNLETGISAQVTQNATNTMAQIAGLRAQAQAASEAGAADFLGTVIGALAFGGFGAGAAAASGGASFGTVTPSGVIIPFGGG